MALEDKKSNLQPSSVKAQQYRLQFSNLEGRANEAIQYNQAPVQVPGGSLFQGGPAPVALSAPVAQQAQAPTVAKVYKTVAGVFDGDTYFTASIGSDIDLNTSTSGSMSFVFMIKPDTVPTAQKQYLLHAYTGSFASHSLEVTLNGYNLEIRATNAGKYNRYYATIPASAWGTEANGYTMIEVGKNEQSYTAAYPLWFTTFYAKVGNRAYNLIPKGNGTVVSHDLPLVDHLNIGGTAAVANSNFSGSIAFVMVKGNTRLTTDQYSKLKDAEVTPGSIIPQVRAYTFDSNGAVEDPGTLADVNVTLGVTGSYSTTTGYY